MIRCVDRLKMELSKLGFKSLKSFSRSSGGGKLYSMPVTGMPTILRADRKVS